MTDSNIEAPFDPRRILTEDIPLYLRGNLRQDAIAGLTVAVMGVPQAMAYALIAGLPPVYGLYTAIVCCTVAALSGSSSHLVTGPTNALCMVILSLTAHLPQKYGLSLLECILLLTLMTGLIQIAFGMLRMGGIIRYVSNSVVVGFTAGAGILIAANQLKNIMGVDIPREHAERFHEVLIKTLEKIPEVNPYSLAIGLGTALLVLLLPKISRKIPAALTAIGAATLLVYLTGWHDIPLEEWQVRVVRDIEPISRSLNIAHLPQLIRHPHYELTRELGAGAVALAILGLIEAASIARAVAAKSGQRLDFNREFTAQGISNVAGAFFSNFAGSGSFTRTAVNYQAGARTRMAAIFSAAWTALTILLFSPVANFIPIASLAGMLIVIAYSMIEKHRLALAWRSGMNSRIVLFGTLLSTLIFPLEYAIFIGVFLSIFFLLKITGRTDLTQLVPRTDSGFDEVPFNRAAPAPIVTVNMEGDLYFAAVEDLDYELQRALTPVTRVVVLRMKRLRAVGSTAMAILEHFWALLQQRNIALVVCGIEEELVKVMTRSGLRRRLGEQNIFYADNKLFQSTELAMARAMSIVEMERRRDEKTGQIAQAVTAVAETTARHLMTRHCIRFGHQHQLREAVWLLAEMARRTPAMETPSLFLQNKEGRLAGKLSVWRLVEEMARSLNLSEMKNLTDPEIGTRLRQNFQKPIDRIARTDLPEFKLETPLAQLLRSSVKNDLRVLPVCDDGRRVIGLISEHDLLRAIGKILEQTSRIAVTPTDRPQ
ncbi:STAS domain-containing protein [bacterium]|nr:STAS domain-containing protein [bacterium]